MLVVLYIKIYQTRVQSPYIGIFLVFHTYPRPGVIFLW